MKLGPIALAAAIVGACSSDYSAPTPTAPTPTAPAPTVYNSLSGKVFDEGAACIEGAKVQVMSGQRAGEEIVQQTPCDYWSYGGDEGFEFTGLDPEAEMTLRASAKGYDSKEVTVSPKRARGRVDFDLVTAQ
jgi:hypothetical protein